MRPSYVDRAFTLLELLACIVAVIVLLVITLPLFGRRPHGGAQIKDATQIRGIQQAMYVWSNQNKGKYPLPSEIDALNATINAPASTKDTTANIFSLLIWSGHISSELTVSVAESNVNAIEQDQDYELDNPKAAASPANALWDPNFSADFTSSKKGNVSYAHLQPAGARRELWVDNFKDMLPIVGNRGPEITAVTYDAATAKPSFTFANPSSNTFLIHGGRSTWEGNIAYNDGHASFETRPAPDSITIPGFKIAGRSVRDTLFYDEPDPAASKNAYLGIFIRAGDTPADFQAIWD